MKDGIRIPSDTIPLTKRKFARVLPLGSIGINVSDILLCLLLLS